MGKAPGDELASEWSFTETLSLDDVEILQREQLEDGKVCTVSYASAIQGRDTSKITYRELRKVCSYLGVRYYKNRPKNLMLELIALKKLKGEVPKRYKLVKTIGKKTAAITTTTTTTRPFVDQHTDNDDHAEHHDHNVRTAANSPCSHHYKRQRVPTDKPLAPALPSCSATNTFLQPVSCSSGPDRPRSPLPDFTSSVPPPPVPSEPSPIYVGISLKDRIDALNLLCHVRQQIQSVEDAIATLTETDSSTKTQRLHEDLQFYLAEQRALIRHLGSSR